MLAVRGRTTFTSSVLLLEATLTKRLNRVNKASPRDEVIWLNVSDTFLCRALFTVRGEKSFIFKGELALTGVKGAGVAPQVRGATFDPALRLFSSVC